MLKNYCAFIKFVERKSAEIAMNTLYNKLTIKDEKYRLSWAQLRDPEKLGDEEEDKEKDRVNTKSKATTENYCYTTECPVYEPNKNNLIATSVPYNKNKIIYSVSLNSYDKGLKPYYPSMDPNAMGGELKIYSKKKIKSEARANAESESNNIINKLMQAYKDI